MSGRKQLGFSVYIQLPTQVTAVPTKHVVPNNFDYISSLLSLDRIAGERNVGYRNRLWDVSVHPSGPLYEGVLNGITRDLGLTRSAAIQITLKLNSAGYPIATSPRVDILANKVVLYSDWRPYSTEVIDKTIRIYQLGDDGYYLDDLVTEINSSTCFSASIVGTTRSNTISNTLVRGTSDYLVIDEYIRADKLTQFRFPYIVRDSISFSDKKIFDTEVTTSPSSDGEYYIDYNNSELHSYNTPTGNSTCTYHAAIFPMDVDATPIQVYTLQDDNFQYELFNHTTLDSGEEVNALPNAEGAEIYHQLFTEVETFWGE